MEQLELWLKFLVAAGIVIGAGLSLTANAEKLADALGWGHAFAGFVILGWATSLPEVTISVSAVLDVESAGLSAGNITGSVIFNLAILALLSLLLGRRTGSVDVSGEGVRPLGVFNLIMLGGTFVLAAWPAWLPGMTARLGLFLLALYALATFWLWWRDRTAPVFEDDVAPPPTARRGLILRCLGAGAVILGAGVWLTNIGDEMAEVYALEEGFVGTLFLAAVSSLPELVTGLAAIRMGLWTLCIGSILGSNIFNLGILGVCDLLWQQGDNAGTSIFEAADDPRLTFNLGAGWVLTVLAMTSMYLRRIGARRPLLTGISFTMLAIYLVAIAPG